MKTSTILAVGAAAALAATFYAAPASAQATRTWVAGLGDDVNPCSRSSPCKTFAGAIGKTAAGGEINCYDSGGYGVVTITKSITINCADVLAGIAASGSTGVFVNAPGSIVVLRGLDIDGFGTGMNGISFLAGAELHVQHCLIRNFRSGTATGIQFAPTAAAQLFVSDTVISDNGVAADPNGSAGIQIEPVGTAAVLAVLERVQVESNVVGMQVQAEAIPGQINVIVRDSVFGGSTLHGIDAMSGATIMLMLDRVASVNNAQAGLRADGADATIFMANSQVMGNGIDNVMTDNARLFSYGNNQMDGNISEGQAPIIIPQK